MNKYNAEGYHDPTAYEALSRIESEVKKKPFRPLVYIVSPFSGETARNTARARNYCRFAVERNAIPLASHLLYPQFMDDGDPAQRNLGLFFGLVLMGKCQEVWCFGENISEGMALELTKAKERRMPIRFFDSHCREVVRP